MLFVTNDTSPAATVAAVVVSVIGPFKPTVSDNATVVELGGAAAAGVPLAVTVNAARMPSP